jgi:hypothetical protein
VQHKSIDELSGVANVIAADVPMSRRERLERWADLLEQDPRRRLRTLEELEYVRYGERLTMRGDDSPLSVAFADPVLRTAGLKSDRYGDAVSFFELSDGDAHRLLCSCLNGRTMDAARVAKRVRAIADRNTEKVTLGLLAAAAVATPLLLYLAA